MKTMETNKKAYMSNYQEVFKMEMVGTIWTEPGQEMWIEEYSYCGWMKRKSDIESKADALMYGIIDAKSYCNKIREEVKKEQNLSSN